LAQHESTWLYDQFHTNLAGHIGSGKVIPVPLSSVQAAHRFAAVLQVKEFFDMVFIDGAHDYASIKADLAAWRPLCKGLFCGHDAGHPPVEQAVHEMFPEAWHEGSMWVVQL
jgi:hypothetical protein